MRMNSRNCGLFLFLLALAAIPAQCGSQVSSSSQRAAAAYPNAPIGLKNLIMDILRAADTKDSAKEAELIHSLLMPEDPPWFTDEYGPGFGASLAAAYRRSVPELEEDIKTVYEANVQRGWTKPKILTYADPGKVNAPIDRFLNSMNPVVPLYQTAFQGDRPGFGVKLSRPAEPLKPSSGDRDAHFAYDRPGFRFIPPDLLMR